MGLLGGLFGKQQSEKQLLAALDSVQGDSAKAARLYYELGKKYYAEQKFDKARLYLGRFDSVVSSDDALYTQFEKKADEVSDLIGELEEKPLLVNQLEEWIEKIGEDLAVSQKRRWNLLTMARFEKLFAKFAALPGFEILKNYGRIVDILSETLARPIEQDEAKLIEGFLDNFYEFTDSAAVFDIRSQVPVAAGAPIQAFDLHGGCGLESLYSTVYDLFQIVIGEASEDWEEPFDMTTDFVAAGLLLDYYARTQDAPVDGLAAVQAEKKRVEADCSFVADYPSDEDFLSRLREYRQMELPL